MDGYLLQSVKRTLVSELQARGYAPHASDVHQAAVSVIQLVEANFEARKAALPVVPVVPVVEDKLVAPVQPIPINHSAPAISTPVQAALPPVTKTAS